MSSDNIHKKLAEALRPLSQGFPNKLAATQAFALSQPYLSRIWRGERAAEARLRRRRFIG